jgi:RHS repeat-associated protein
LVGGDGFDSRRLHSAARLSNETPGGFFCPGLAPMSMRYRNTALCVADCFEASITYATPAYVSLDQERAVALAYRSGQAVPRVLVEVDAHDASLQVPQAMSLRVRRPNGTMVTFTNGTSEIFYQSGNGVSRLSAQFDPGTLATGSYAYQVLVRTWWPNGQMKEALPKDFRFTVLDERASTSGAGWSVVGLQRLHIQSDGILLTQGDGSWVFFEKAGSSWTSPNEESSTLIYDSGSGRYTRTFPDQSVVVFNGAGRMLFIKDRFQNQTTYGYDGSGRLTTITDPIGSAISLAYTNGKLASISDPTGRSSTFSVVSDQLRTITDPDNVVALSLTYDAAHRITQFTDRRGGTWNPSLDATNTTLNSLTYPTVVVGTTSVRPVATFSSWAKAVLPAAGGTSGNPAPRVVPAALRAQVTNPRGNTTSFVLNPYGAATLVEEPLNHVTEIAWNDQALPTLVKSPSGARVTYGWYSRGRLKSVSDHVTGAITTIEYDATYSQPRFISVGGVQTTNYIGTNGRVDSTKVGALPATKYLYDTRGRVTRVTDPQGRITLISYYASGRQNTQTVSVAGRATTVQYDAVGRPDRVTDPVSNVTLTAYDVLNRVTSITDPLNHVTTLTYAWNKVDLHTVTDAKGQVYKDHHNALGWLTSRVDPRNQTIQYRYDSHGNRTTAINRRGQTITLGYDALDRLTTRTADGQTTSWAYDNATVGAVNRWMRVSNPVSRDSIMYDMAGRVRGQHTLRGSTWYRLGATYLKEGPRQTLTMTAPWARTISYSHDNALRLTAIVDQAGRTTNFTRNSVGLPTSVSLPTAATKLTETRSYTSTHALGSSSFNIAAVNSLAGFKYGYDNIDRMTRRSTRYSQGDSIRDFEYDKASQLTRHVDKRTIETQEEVCPTLQPTDCYWVTVTDTVTLGTTAYTYDAARNRTDKGAVLQTGNRLVSFDGWSLVYDQDGNITQKSKSGVGSYQYEWNSLGQLTKVTANGQVVTYQYDGLGRWARRGSIDYIYDNQHLFMEVNGSTLLREYAYREGVDQPLMVRNFEGEAGGVYYYVAENPGHATGLVNTSNQVVNKYRYDPWGAEQHCTEAKPNPLRFAGRHYDATGQIYQMRARWYDPHTGRFLSEDPIGLAGGINPYAYAGNSPTNARDPSGLCVDYVTASAEDRAAVDRGEKLPCSAVQLPGVTATVSRYSDPYIWIPGQRGPAIPGAGPDGSAWGHVGPDGSSPAVHPDRSRRDCFVQNTAPVVDAITSATAAATGAMATLTAGMGYLAEAHGKWLIREGFLTRTPTAFRAAQNGIVHSIRGPAWIAFGASITSAASYAGTAVGGLGGAYFATSALICAVYPNY